MDPNSSELLILSQVLPFFYIIFTKNLVQNGFGLLHFIINILQDYIWTQYQSGGEH